MKMDHPAQRAFKTDRLSRSCAVDLLSLAIFMDNTRDKIYKGWKPLWRGHYIHASRSAVEEIIRQMDAYPNIHEWDSGV